MNLYNVTYWNSVAWKQKELEIIAESKDDIKAYIDSEVPVEYRIQYNRNNQGEDSLIIDFEKKITIPYIVKDISRKGLV